MGTTAQYKWQLRLLTIVFTALLGVCSGFVFFLLLRPTLWPGEDTSTGLWAAIAAGIAVGVKDLFVFYWQHRRNECDNVK